MSSGFRPRRECDLDDGQRWAVDLVEEIPYLLLVLPVGGGKTSITLTAIKRLIKKREVRRVLVVAPLRVAEEVWTDEINAWVHLWSLRASVVTGSEKGRLFALRQEADIYTINRENLRWLWLTMRELGLPMFDMLVIDESTMLQDGKKRTAPRKIEGKATGGNKLSRFGAVVNFRRHAKRVVELTGTVAPEGLRGLWGQVYALDFGERLGASREDFERRWFQSDFMGYKLKPVKGAFEDITDRIKDIVVAPDVSETVKKIPVRFNPIWIRLSEAEMRRYRAFEHDLYEEETDIEAITQGVLTNKLCQFANGSIYDADGKDIHVHDRKLHALEDLVDELNGERLLVAYSYKFDLDRIRKRYPKAVVLNEEPGAYQAWKRGEIDMLLAHPRCLHPSTLVLTEHRGWVQIVDVASWERVFDGVEFVRHGGCTFSGMRPVIQRLGITATPDHEILVGSEWRELRHVGNSEDAAREARYAYPGDDPRLGALLSLRCDGANTGTERATQQPGESRSLPHVSSRDFPQDDAPETVPNLEGLGLPRNRRDGPGLQELRSAGANGRSGVAGLPGVLAGYAARLFGRAHDRAHRQYERLLSRKLPMGDQRRAAVQQKKHPSSGVSRLAHALSGILPLAWSPPGSDHTLSRQIPHRGSRDSGVPEVALPTGTPEPCAVFDLVDCGPRHRFAVRNEVGDVFIVHNSAGHGLNMQSGGHHACWYGFNWSVELWLQFNGRLPRRGQAHSFVTIHMIQARGTVDETIVEKMRTGTATQDEITAAVMRRIEPKWVMPTVEPRRRRMVLA